MILEKESPKDNQELLFSSQNSKDPKLQQERQKQIQKQTQKENFKINTWAKRFKHEEIQIKHLKSVFIDNNEHFQECLGLIKGYNDEVQRAHDQQREVRDGPFKLKLSQQLQVLLHEVMMTKDRVIQKHHCQEIHVWALQQYLLLDPKNKELKERAHFATLEFEQQNQTFQTQQIIDHCTIPEADDTIYELDQTQQFAKTQNMNHRKMNTMSASTRPDKNTTMMTQPGLQSYSGQQSFFTRPESANMPTKSSQLIRPDSAAFDKSFKTRPESAIQWNNRPESASFQQNLSYGAFQNIRPDSQIEQSRFMTSNQLELQLQPSDYISEIMRDYENQNRTFHHDVTPPYEKLKEYRRKQLNFQPKQEENKDQIEESTVAYVKPLNYLPYKEEELVIEEQKIELDSQKDDDEEGGDGEGGDEEGGGNLGGDAPEEVDPNQQSPPPPLIDGQEAPKVEGDKKLEEKKPEVKPEEPKKLTLNPDIQAYTSDIRSKDRSVPDLNKKIEQRSNYIAYLPTENVKEMEMERYWLKNRNKELQNKRVDEEMVHMLKDWSKAKARMDKEITRKIDSQIYGNQYQKCEYKGKDYSPRDIASLDRRTKAKLPMDDSNVTGEDIEPDDIEAEEFEQQVKNVEEQLDKQKLNGRSKSAFPATEIIDHSQVKFPSIAKQQHVARISEYRDLEKHISDTKIDNVKKLYGNLIGIKSESGASKVKSDLEEQREGVSTAKSLSVFANPRVKKIEQRPLSALLEKHTPDLLQEDEISEIYAIKERLVKNKIHIPIQTLMNAMISPENLPDEKLQKLPPPGLNMYNNPYMVSKKKKKKGKKKKKK